MMSRRGTGILLPAGLLVLCLGLGYSTYSALRTVPEAPRSAEQGVPVAPPPVPAKAEFTMPPRQDFVEIVSRPIFSPTRRPPPDTEVSFEEVRSELEVKLVGVVIASGDEIAIVTPKNGSAFVRLSEGDRYQGWTVEQIDAQGVTFRRNEVLEQIGLDYDQPPVRKPTRNEKRKKNKRQQELQEQEDAEQATQ